MLIRGSRSNVLEHITTHRASRKEVGICFAYYNYQSPDMEALSLIISALIKQLCRSRDAIPTSFMRLKQDSMHASTVGNIDSFITIAKKFDEVFLLIDGLDECSQQKRHLVHGFLSAAVDTLPRLKVFVTSRREQDILRAFEKLTTPTIEVEAKSVAGDILSYVTDEIKRLSAGDNGQQLFVKSDMLRQKIVQTLTAKADGMYVAFGYDTMSSTYTNLLTGSSGLICR